MRSCYQRRKGLSENINIVISRGCTCTYTCWHLRPNIHVVSLCEFVCERETHRVVEKSLKCLPEWPLSMFAFTFTFFLPCSVRMRACIRARVRACTVTSSDLSFVMHGSLWHFGLPQAPSCDPIHFYPVHSSVLPSVLLSLPPPVFLSFVYLLMCEIILGWRDGFLPDGLSGGVSLLFNNRLGVYVYLSIEIDDRPV